MSQAPEDAGELPGIIPNVSACKTIGTLNIIFACGLLLIGLCCGVQFLFQSTFGPMVMQQQQAQMKAVFLQARQQEIQRLKDKEKAAKTDEEKKTLQAKLKQLEDQPEPKPPDLTKMYATDNPQVIAYSTTDVVSGIILNILMLLAGVGLVAVKEWGRKLGVWVALLKIVRLVAVYGFNIIVIVPIVTQRFVQFMKEMMENVPQGQGAGAGAPTPEGMASIVGTVMTVMAVGMMILGAIYPLAALIVLTRPSVKAACSMPDSSELE